MVAIKAQDVERTLAKPDPVRPYVLIFGPDSGLVRERINIYCRATGIDQADPFAAVTISSDDLAGNPDRLLDEALTISLLGGRRLVRVTLGPRISPQMLQRLLAAQTADAWVVIEGGDLKPDNAIRQLFQKATNAVAIACYPDGEREIQTLIENEIVARGLTIDRDARALLASLLGSDRGTSRNELAKLALYAAPGQPISPADIEAVIADASAIAADAIIDAALGGDARLVTELFAKGTSHGLSPATIISALNRHLLQLHAGRHAIEQGQPLANAIAQHFPRLNFRRTAGIERQHQIWTAGRLLNAIEIAAEALSESRKSSTLAAEIVERALLNIAQRARKA